MFRTMGFIVCLLAGMCQITRAEECHPAGLKSSATAARYSAYGTTVPMAVGMAMIVASASRDEPLGEGLSGAGFVALGVGVAAGPGFGHAYAGRWGHLVRGSALRTFGAILMTAGMVKMICGDDCSGMGNWGKAEEEIKEDESGGLPVFMIGGAIYFWSAIHDFTSLEKAVERYNKRHVGVSLSVGPTYDAHGQAPGIVISLSF